VARYDRRRERLARRQSPAPKADVATEAIAGITTFFTMAYIVVVNPSILSTTGTGISFSGALTATGAAVLHPDHAHGPLRAPALRGGAGHGRERFFTFNLILSRGIPWQVALGMVFWAGVLFLLLSATPSARRS
jgi:AGZA family xanthine/uracil permease-like MFS transporter